MKRIDFIKKSLIGSILSVSVEPVRELSPIKFEDLLYQPYPGNKNLYNMKPGKYKDFVLARIKSPVRDYPVYNAAHGYKIPPVFKDEEELYDHLKLMVHELNKAWDRGTDHRDGEHFRFMKLYKVEEFQLQWF